MLFIYVGANINKAYYISLINMLCVRGKFSKISEKSYESRPNCEISSHTAYDRNVKIFLCTIGFFYITVFGRLRRLRKCSQFGWRSALSAIICELTIFGIVCSKWSTLILSIIILLWIQSPRKINYFFNL